MTILEHYLEEGFGIREISLLEKISVPLVREILREAGIIISAGGEFDPVTTIVKAGGFNSFHEFVRRNGFRPIKDQAIELGVSRSALTRTYCAYRQFRASKPSEGELPGSGSREDPPTQGDD